MNTRSILRLALLLSACSTAYGAPVIHEPFAQTAGSISGKAGGTGLGSWAVVAGPPTVATTPTLVYGQVVNSGGQVSIPNGSGVTAYVTTTSALANAGLLADGATLWFSFVYSKAAGGGTNERSGFAFGTDHLVTIGTGGATMSNSGNGLGLYTRDNGIVPITWNGGGGGTTATGTTFTSYGETVTVVGRIVWGATSGNVESLTIWSPNEVSLPLNVAALGTGFSTTMTGVDQTAFDTISMQQRNSGGAIIYDELRFGATYQDVIAATTASVYWDPNGTVAGAGGTPNGDWDGATTPWNTDYTGGSAGTLSTWPAGGVAILSAGSDASGAYTVNLDGTRSVAGVIVKNGDPTISGGTALDVVASGAAFNVLPGLAATIATPVTQSITGTGNLSKDGAGTLTLSNNNTYACPTAVNAGKLILSGDNSGSSSAVTVNGGVVQFNSTTSIPSTGRSVTVNAGNGAVMFDALSDADIATGMGRIVAASAGTVAADNNPGAAFDFNTAGLTAAYFGAVGSVNYTGTLTPNSTAKYRLGGGGGTLTLANAGALTGSNAVNFVGPGTVVVAASNSGLSGGAVIPSGATVKVTHSSALGTGGVPATFTGTLILGSNLTGGQMIFSNGARVRSDGTTDRTISNVTLANANNTVILGNATDNGKLTFNAAAGNKLSSSGYTFQCDSDVEFTTGFQNAATGFTKAGTGTMTISGMAGTSGFSGGITLSNGTLAGIGVNAFGSTSGIGIAAAGTLSLRGDSDTTFVKKSDGTTRISLSTSASAATINVDQATIAGTSAKTMTVGALSTSSVAATYQVNFSGANNTSLSLGAVAGSASTAAGTVTLSNQIASTGELTLASYTSANTSGNETLVLTGAGTTNITGAITPSATVLSLQKSGGGTAILTGSSGFTGTTVVTAGTLSINSIGNVTGGNSALGNPANASNGIIRLGNDSNTGTLIYTGGVASTDRQIQINVNANSNTGSGVLRNNGGGTLTFTAGAFNTSYANANSPTRNLTLGGSNNSVIEGTIQDHSATSKLALIKEDAGTCTLTGANSYSGATTVNDGTLLINSPGSLAASSDVTVNGGTFGGTGTIGGNVTIAAAGNLAPGASAGTLSVTGNLDISAMAGGAGELKYELDALAGTNDLIAVTGTLTIGTLALDDLEVTNLGSLQVGTYTLITSAGITGTVDGTVSLIATGFNGKLQITGSNLQLIVSAAGGSNYTTWATLNSAGPNLSDDHDNDGVDNGTEYFLFGPSGSSTGFTTLPGVDKALDGTLSVTWNKGAGYIGTYNTHFVVETSSTLTGPWTAEASPGNIIDSLASVKYTFPGGPAYSGKNFARLKVTGP